MSYFFNNKIIPLAVDRKKLLLVYSEFKLKSFNPSISFSLGIKFSNLFFSSLVKLVVCIGNCIIKPFVVFESLLIPFAISS